MIAALSSEFRSRACKTQPLIDPFAGVVLTSASIVERSGEDADVFHGRSNSISGICLALHRNEKRQRSLCMRSFLDVDALVVLLLIVLRRMPHATTSTIRYGTPAMESSPLRARILEGFVIIRFSARKSNVSVLGVNVLRGIFCANAEVVNIAFAGSALTAFRKFK